ncbi:MAG: hypothetical protein M1358_22995 [Chloroflexi bacterium]|nr:hypothetical protein [Chloroflexota bacterium]
MIVRITSEGQYHVDDRLVAKLNDLDNRIVQVVAVKDKGQFQELLLELVTLVRENGQAIGYETLQESQLILPPPDLSFEEAQALFTGEGLIPG